MRSVDDSTITKPLVKALREHVDVFAESIADQRRTASGRGLKHDALTKARPAAVAWVYMTALVAWAEDHKLIDPWLRSNASADRKAFLELPGMTATAWVSRAIASLCAHPATTCLLDPRYTPIHPRHEPGVPSAPDDGSMADLLTWWERGAPLLRHEVDKGPASVSGWLPGTLLQDLSDERRKGFALAQTPWWVADFMLDRTLIPAANEFRDETLRTIDPCCGTGHFLIRKIDYLWELYTTGALAPRQATGGPHATGWTPVAPAEAIQRIIAGVHGCERDPLTAAVARLRFVVAIGDLMHQAGLLDVLRLDRIPPFQPVIAVGDSLLAGMISKSAYAELHPDLAAIENLGYDDPATEPEPTPDADLVLLSPPAEAPPETDEPREPKPRARKRAPSREERPSLFDEEAS